MKLTAPATPTYALRFVRADSGAVSYVPDPEATGPLRVALTHDLADARDGCRRYNAAAAAGEVAWGRDFAVVRLAGMEIGRDLRSLTLTFEEVDDG